MRVQGSVWGVWGLPKIAVLCLNEASDPSDILPLSGLFRRGGGRCTWLRNRARARIPVSRLRLVHTGPEVVILPAFGASVDEMALLKVRRVGTMMTAQLRSCWALNASRLTQIACLSGELFQPNFFQLFPCLLPSAANHCSRVRFRSHPSRPAWESKDLSAPYAPWVPCLPVGFFHGLP